MDTIHDEDKRLLGPRALSDGKPPILGYHQNIQAAALRRSPNTESPRHRRSLIQPANISRCLAIAASLQIAGPLVSQPPVGLRSVKRDHASDYDSTDAVFLD